MAAKVLKGVKVMWAKVHEPDTRFAPVYSLDAVELTPEQVKQLEADGLQVKEKDGQKFFKFKKKAISKDGKPLSPPKVLDKYKQEFKEPIGNGSICNIAYEPYEYEFAGRKGITSRLVALQVVDLVPYGQKVEDLFDEEEGDFQDDDNPFA